MRTRFKEVHRKTGPVVYRKHAAERPAEAPYRATRWKTHPQGEGTRRRDVQARGRAELADLYDIGSRKVLYRKGSQPVVKNFHGPSHSVWRALILGEVAVVLRRHTTITYRPRR